LAIFADAVAVAGCGAAAGAGGIGALGAVGAAGSMMGRRQFTHAAAWPAISSGTVMGDWQ
jgi:hypothetical protein